MTTALGLAPPADLTSHEAAVRLARDGANMLPRRHPLVLVLLAEDGEACTDVGMDV